MAFVRTRIAVSGFTAAEVRDGLTDLLNEFRNRPSIIHLTGGLGCLAPHRRLVVTTHYKGDDPDRLERAASDEDWDLVIACINFTSKGMERSIEREIHRHPSTQSRLARPLTQTSEVHELIWRRRRARCAA